MKKLIIILTITAFVPFMSGAVSYSITPEEYEKRSNNGSGIMAPGYLNIDKQRSESMKESMAPKSSTDEQAEEINADLGKSMLETEPDKIKVDLKGPRGGGGTAASSVYVTAFGVSSKLTPEEMERQ